MRNSWLIWFLGIGIIVAIFWAFNHQGTKGAVSLVEIFPDEETFPIVDVEYEFVDSQAVIEPPKVEPKPASEPVKKEVQPKVTEAVKANFSIQVASFQQKERAEQVVAELKAKNYAPYIKSRNLGEKGTWYRVYVGEYTTKAQAQEILSVIQNHYKNSFIIAIQ